MFLPNEIQYLIISKLPLDDMFTTKLVNRMWREFTFEIIDKMTGVKEKTIKERTDNEKIYRIRNRVTQNIAHYLKDTLIAVNTNLILRMVPFIQIDRKQLKSYVWNTINKKFKARLLKALFQSKRFKKRKLYGDVQAEDGILGSILDVMFRNDFAFNSDLLTYIFTTYPPPKNNSHLMLKITQWFQRTMLCPEVILPIIRPFKLHNILLETVKNKNCEHFNIQNVLLESANNKTPFNIQNLETILNHEKCVIEESKLYNIFIILSNGSIKTERFPPSTLFNGQIDELSFFLLKVICNQEWFDKQEAFLHYRKHGGNLTDYRMVNLLKP